MRLGFLGVGWIGRNRLEAVARSGIAEIVAIADPSRPDAEAARVAAPTARRMAFASLRVYHAVLSQREATACAS